MTARVLSRLALLVAMMATLLVAAPAQADTAIRGMGCTTFRGAERCAYVLLDDQNAYKVPHFGTIVEVSNGGGARVIVTKMQRRTPDGWKTLKQRRSDGPSSNPQVDVLFVAKAQCGDLRRGVYRARGKVHWTSEGVHYTRWINGKAIRKKAMCRDA